MLSADGESSTWDVYFVGRHAVQFAEGPESEPEAIYDLKEMSWQDVEPRRTVHLADWEAWAKTSSERSRASLTNLTDPVQRRFAEFTIAPRFDVTAEDGKLTMVGDILRYEILSKQVVPRAQLDRLFAWDILNAYRKAMLQRKILPFIQLAVSKELSARGMVPSELTLSVDSRKGIVSFETKMRVSSMIPEEKERAEAIVRKWASH